MSSSDLEDASFRIAADQTLQQLERQLGLLDPDEVDVNLGSDVLSLIVKNQHHIVIHRHGAARQIWMAAQRKGWHFDLSEDRLEWKTSRTGEELFDVLQKILSSLLGKEIRLQ